MIALQNALIAFLCKQNWINVNEADLLTALIPDNCCEHCNPMVTRRAVRNSGLLIMSSQETSASFDIRCFSSSISIIVFKTLVELIPLLSGLTSFLFKRMMHVPKISLSTSLTSGNRSLTKA